MPPIRRGDAPDQYGPRGVSNVGRDDLRALHALVVYFGAGHERLWRARLLGAGTTGPRRTTRMAPTAARISAFPTFMMVSMGRGEPATLEIASLAGGTTPRIDQISALDRLVIEAERGAVNPGDLGPSPGSSRSTRMQPPVSAPVPPNIVGYAVLTLGLCLILQPTAPPEVIMAAGLGGRRRAVALDGEAFTTAAAGRPARPRRLHGVGAQALAVDQDLTGPGLSAMVASLVVFLPGRR